MTKLIVAVVFSAVLAAQTGTMPPLEKLFARPYAWGTSPTGPRWSKNGAVLLFLWNAEGRRFRDLYAWQAGPKKLVRLTDLESLEDDLNRSPEEKDDLTRRYLAPQAGLSSFDVSENGRVATFTYKNDLYVAYTDGSQPLARLTRTKAAETSAQLSPDGARLYSIRSGQLHVQELATGVLWQATDIEQGTLAGYDGSPDGKRFIYRVEKGTPRQMPLPNYSGRFVTARQFNRSVAGDEPAEIALSLVPVEGGQPRSIDRGGDRWIIINLEWAPDSNAVLISQISPDWKTRRIAVIDLATAKARTIFEETDSRWVDYGFAAWSPDGKQVLFTSERDGWAHLYRIGVEGGEPFQLTRGQYEIRSEPFSQDPQWIGEWIYFSSNEGDTAQRHFYRVSPDGKRKEKLSDGEGLRIGIVSEQGSRIAMLRAGEKEPFDLWVDGQRITESPRPEFARYPWPEVRYVSFPSARDGKPVRAKMLLPPGYSEARRYPAVVYIHGAGIATSVLKQWGSYNELRYVYNAFLTSRGYVILDLDYRGSTGYGRDWRSDVYLHLGGKDLEDVLGGVEYLRSLGAIDMQRIGIWGVSYGGFLTNVALFQAPGVFRAGSSWAAVNDWENYNAGYTAQRLNTPASNPEAYRRSSPIYFTQNLQDRLLIVHGMVDNNVLFQDAVQLTEKLIHERKEFSHIFYPQESHGFVRDETWIDALRRTTEWFERYLQ